MELHPDHASRQPTELAWQIPIACIQWLRYSWWWTVNLSETCRGLYQINLRNCASCWLLLHLVGFYCKNISRCSVLWMSNLSFYGTIFLYFLLIQYPSLSCIISRRVTTISTSRSSLNLWLPRLCFQRLRHTKWSVLETVDNRPAPLEGCLQDFPFLC